MFFSILRYANWREWPESEQDAVEAYLIALWQVVLSVEPFDLVDEADHHLCAIGQAVDNLEPFLYLWRNNRSMSAIRHLALFVVRDAPSLRRKNKLSDSFWGARRPQMKQVIDWLLDSATAEMLERAYFEYADEPFADDLAAASDELNWIRKISGAKSGT
jgi:hypothetical protein